MRFLLYPLYYFIPCRFKIQRSPYIDMHNQIEDESWIVYAWFGSSDTTFGFHSKEAAQKCAKERNDKWRGLHEDFI